VKVIAPVVMAFLLTACATTTARMHSADELAAVTRECGVAYGDITQFDEEPRLLFLMAVERPAQFVCVSRWARARGLRLVYMENAERVPDAADQP